jgi:hypothetical protein
MRKIITLSLIIGLIFIVACDREIPNPVINPTIPDIPASPTNLNTKVADRTLLLTWTDNDTSIAFHRIYQADSLYGDYEVFDSAEVTSYTATDLYNGRYYFYKVTSVNSDGVESNLSAAVYAVPNLFSMIINDGLEQTNERYVTLTMIAPEGTSLMRIANSVDFTQSPWEPFAATKTWLMTQGNGLKTVYAMFRDGNGNDTRDTLSDNITLNILPFQYSISVDGDAELAYSRVVDLTIGAPQETSFMMISNSTDFTNAVWESYSATRSWHIPPAVADNRDDVGFYVLFRDGNADSVDVMASDSIVLAVADPVNLYPVNQPADSYQDVNLEWSRSMSGDFLSYRIFRSRGSSDVDTMVTTIFDKAQSTYTDNLNIDNLPDSTPDSVYYMIRFYSVYNDSSDSDPVLVRLINNGPPTLNGFIRNISYDIDTLTGVDMSAVFGWERSNIIDHDHYVVYENTTLDTTTADPVFYIYEQSTLSYDINKNNVDTLEVFYYWVKVLDSGGQSSRFSQPDSVYY